MTIMIIASQEVEQFQRSVLGCLDTLGRSEINTSADAQTVAGMVNDLLNGIIDRPHAQKFQFCKDVIHAMTGLALREPANTGAAARQATNELNIAMAESIAWLAEEAPPFAKPAVHMLSLIGRASKDWLVRDTVLTTLFDLSHWEGKVGWRAVDALEEQASDNSNSEIRDGALLCLQDLASQSPQALKALVRSAEQAAALETSPDRVRQAYWTLTQIVENFELGKRQLRDIGARFQHAATGVVPGGVRDLAMAGLQTVKARLDVPGNWS